MQERTLQGPCQKGLSALNFLQVCNIVCKCQILLALTSDTRGPNWHEWNELIYIMLTHILLRTLRMLNYLPNLNRIVFDALPDRPPWSQN